MYRTGSYKESPKGTRLDRLRYTPIQRNKTGNTCIFIMVTGSVRTSLSIPYRAYSGMALTTRHIVNGEIILNLPNRILA